MAKFIHLHGHSEYSLLDGLPKLSKLASEAKNLGMEALAITDHGTMYGVIEFYKACLKTGIKPIIGCEVYVAPRSHKDKEAKLDTEPQHLILLAKNHQGYLNLMKLVSIAHLEGFYYKPRVDKELLRQYHEGLVCLSGCPAGEFIRSLDGDDLKKAETVARTYLEIFGEGNYYLELQSHPYAKFIEQTEEHTIKQDLLRMQLIQEKSIAAVKQLSPKLGIPYVATNDFHYIKKDDAEAQDALLCIQTGKLLSDINRLRMIDTPDYYLKSADEMLNAFVDMPEALETSIKIADICNVEIEIGKSHFPVFKSPEEKSPMDYLRELTYEGAKRKLRMSKEEIERIEYELDIINFKNYADYFLVVSDFMNWSHDQGIITNTRGSAAGSIVLYCLGVTNLNPLDYMLPFERFLTKFRPSLPDIDADLADDRRDDVIRYVMKKYGEDRVAHIITFGTMMGRAAIRDVGRVMGMVYGEVDKIAKLVPPPHQGFHKPLDEAIKEVAELAEMYRSNSQVKRLMDLAMRIEGTVRHASVHAAGIVISPDEITNFTPLQREANGDKVVCQYDMFSVEDAGLVKMDFLGIRNLSILGRAIEYVKHNQQKEIDLNKIPLSDKKAFELLAKGETMGVFQLSSDGMTKYLVELKPNNIADLAAMVALYRPGPLSVIPEYIARKHNPNLIKYYDPRMEDYMKQSLGLMVYQEDVLFTSIYIAGYSWEEADKFRKAMGKKIPEEMAKQKDHFVSGASSNGMIKEKAEELFALIAPFAAYGFNKSHAASYAMVAYHTAYMKANFPVEFMAAVMTAEYGDTEKIAEAIEECKKMGIPALPPDIGFSKVGFTIENLKDLSPKERARQLNDVKNIHMTQGIRFGLSAIKNVGISAIESIVKAREEKPFKHMMDICTRVDTRLVNKKTLESLIKAGALDNFGSRTAQLLALDKCLEEAHKASKAAHRGQVSLFGDLDNATEVKFELSESEEMPIDQILAFEKELLGFYLHEPTYVKDLRKMKDFFQLKISDFDQSQVGRKLVLGGVLMDVKKVLTKKNASEMAFLKLVDSSGEIECVVFPKLYTEKKNMLIKETAVVLWGKLDLREDKFSIIVDSIERFDPANLPVVDISSGVARKAHFKEIEIELPRSASGDILKKINQTLRQYPGSSPICLLIPAGNMIKKMDLNFTVKPDDQLVKNIEEILGAGCIKFV